MLRGTRLVGRIRNISQFHNPVLVRQNAVRSHAIGWCDKYAPAVNYSNDVAPKSKRQERLGKLRTVLKDYGPVGVVFHTVISLASLGSCYMVVKSGVDMEKIFVYFNIDVTSSTYKTASTMGMAYILHKIFLPVRAFVTITSVPIIVRYLRAKGILKTIPKQTK